MQILVPDGHTLKVTRRQTNSSKTILLTVNKDEAVEAMTIEPFPVITPGSVVWLRVERA